MTTEEKVRDVLVNELGVDREQLTDEANFVTDLGADSLDTIEVVMAIEDEFGIEIADEEAEGVETVGALVALVERLAAAR